MRAALAVYSLVMVAFYLWPFELEYECRTCRNGAEWQRDAGAVAFRAPGMVRSVQPPVGMHRRLVRAEGLTVEAWVTSAGLDQGGPARIVSYSADPTHRNFTLGQEGDALVFRLRTTETDPNALEGEITVPGAVRPGQRQHLAVSSDLSGFRVFVDGRLEAELAGPGGDLSAWDPDHTLLVGNEATGDRPWLGTVERVVVRDRAVAGDRLPAGRGGAVAAFDFTAGVGNVIHDSSGVEPPSHLERPAVFRNVNTPDLLTAQQRKVSDVAGRFVVFLPFGALVFLLLQRPAGDRRTALLASLVLVGAAATVLEALQFYVPARTSSLIDLASAVLGGLAGSLAAPRLGGYLRLG